MNQRHWQVARVFTLLAAVLLPAAGCIRPAPATGGANACVFAENPGAWGPGGSSGAAREWLLGQCDLAESSVITYIELPPTCRDQQAADCLSQNLLGACGAVTVALNPADCRNCRSACINPSATCDRGRCSNTGDPCVNPEQCSFSKPVQGSCPTGTTLVENWAQYYQLKTGLGDAPTTYCRLPGAD